jgi:hypothetical protein
LASLTVCVGVVVTIVIFHLCWNLATFRAPFSASVGFWVWLSRVLSVALIFAGLDTFHSFAGSVRWVGLAAVIIMLVAWEVSAWEATKSDLRRWFGRTPD